MEQVEIWKDIPEYKGKYQETLDTIAEKDKKITELEAKVKKLSYFVTNQIRIEIEGE